MDSLSNIVKEARLIEIRARGMVFEEFNGEYQSAFKGRGIDFHDLREYLHGDEVRSIDWNTTARMAQPYVKQFIEQRELTLYVVIDISASSKYGSLLHNKRRVAAIISSIFSLSASQNGDKVGLLLYSDTVELFVPAKKGSPHCMRLLREILRHSAKNQNSDPSSALKFLLTHQPRRSLVLLVSDFLCEDFTKPLKICAARNDVIAVQIIDPAEESLPSKGRVRLSNPETGMTQLINSKSEKVRNVYDRNRSEWQSNLDQLFENNRVDKITVTTDPEANLVSSLHAFFRKRKV